MTKVTIKTSALPCLDRFQITINLAYNELSALLILPSSGNQTAMEHCLAGSSVFLLLVAMLKVQAQHRVSL